MTRTEVHKFGGTSVGDAARIRSAARLVVTTARNTRLAVVTSAMAGVTDQLVRAATSAKQGKRESALASLTEVRTRHHQALAQICGTKDPEVAADIDRIVGELEDLLRSVSLLGELTARVRDRIVSCGEKLSVRLFAAALRCEGAKGVALDADTFLETDGRFGEAAPLAGVADRTITAKLGPLLEQGAIPVVTGFCGRGPDGATTTLGRGGSDLSATVLAAALDADEVTIWTDVDGVFTADPRIVPEARVLEQLNYREAGELSYYGAKVLHQRTMIPVAAKGIPVRTRNSLNPAAPGTVVDGRFTPGSHPVKGISAIRAQCLISLEGKGMAGVPGVAARMFRSLADHGISVTMISQSSSESSICIAVPDSDANDAERALKLEFRPDLSRGDIEEVVVQHRVGLVGAIGLGMAQVPGIAARVFQALARRRINVLAIAQGSSELNISLAVGQSAIESAIRVLHEDFLLHRIDTGEDSAHGFDLMLLGCGQVGRQFAELVLDREAHVFERFGLRARIVAIADRSGFLFRPTGLPLEELRQVLGAKGAGQRLAALPGVVLTADPADMVRHACQWRLVRPVLVDVSDADTSHHTFLAAMKLGCDVVTANKKPLAGSMATFTSLLGTAEEHERILRAEATVGAGLPVIDTLDTLISTGDRLTRARGCFSGTLGYLMTRVQQGARFSEAVREAVDLGYTEPDPVVDLCGTDVARKALILGRFGGLVDGDTPLVLTGLVDPSWAGMEREALLSRLEDLDDAMAQRVAAARIEGKVVRYTARVEAGRVVVGPEAVPADSTLGMLEGTDNMIVFESARYREHPLVVQGPGAGQRR
ncbi:MAG: bifunctional aspartate kinase/homoserine dehydrogenase I [Deltaproteobacteria bacterium]|nr:bifunctional aspartate kinase/homoserine dehydrogenase I [Deltaproteobacteria bacterium]